MDSQPSSARPVRAGGAGGGTGKRAIPSIRSGPLPSTDSVLRINDLSLPHVESFNYMLDAGLQVAVADIPAREFKVASGDTMRLWIESAAIGVPMKGGSDTSSASSSSAADARLFPAECRERGMTYAAPLSAVLCRQVNGGEVQRMQARLGDVPIMVRSSRCHLHGRGPLDLVRAGEEANEFGGYFICNGIERIIRMLQIPKRNYPMAITRSAYMNRGPLYSNKGVVIRCARPDQSSVTLTLHYLNDGSATVRFTVRKQEFFLPVIMVLKALVPTTDREIYERVLAGDRDNTYLSDRVLMLLRDAKRYEAALHSRDAALAYLGARFRTVLDIPDGLTDVEVGQTLLDRFVLVHIPREGARDKYNLLVLMLRKLYAFVAGNVLEDNADSLTNQELLLSGHLLLLFLKEKLVELTQGIETSIKKEDGLHARAVAAKARAAEALEAHEGAGRGASSSSSSAAAALPKILASAHPVVLADSAWFRKVVERQPEVGRKVYYLLATGNLVSSTGLDMMQVSGYTVVADKINFLRFTTHFRSVHRGQFFTEMKTTTVRKLLPENWGFLCPVHTPDGGPCGLLNHLAQPATVVAHPLSVESFARAAARAAEEDAGGEGPPAADKSSSSPAPFAKSLEALLVALGMSPHAATGAVLPADQLAVVLDGRVLGGAPPHVVYRISRALRYAKAVGAGVAAQLDGVGGDIRDPVQADAIAALRRAAVLGLTDVRDMSRDARRKAHVGDEEGEEGADEDNEAMSDAGAKGKKKSSSSSKRAAAAAAAVAAAVAAVEATVPPALRLPGLGLGAIGTVPPSMEVAFVPPAWWDAEVDPRIEDMGAAERRASRLTFVGAAAASSSSSSSSKDAAGDEKKSEGAADLIGAGGAPGSGTGLPTDDDPEPPTKLVGLFPGLFLQTAPQRLIRPVLQLDTGLVELVSPLEQPFLDIACTPEDIRDILHVPLPGDEPVAALAEDEGGGAGGGRGKKTHSRKGSEAALAPSSTQQRPAPLLYTHIELSAVAMLSELACLTPFSDMNQSPRNMYQCQMAKQTMGTPLHSWGRRTDTKLFRLTTPQAPLVQNAHQALYGFDEYPNGANACVAVIAYTGFDMEDACIINKSAFERGFGWASVYKTYEVDLIKDRPSSDMGRYVFHNTYVKGEPPVRVQPPPGAPRPEAAAGFVRARPGDRVFEGLDEDGLPPLGLLLKEGDPLYAYLDTVTSTHRVTRHKEIEPAYVDEIRFLGPVGTSAAAADAGPQRVSIKLRFDRRPVVGDKFSSRHGQKGVLSYLWPQENMPFNEQGMTPDVIINPHAFPSRMTIGMLVESMAGKAGALHGVFQDSTPFRFNEKQRAVDHFGEQLRSAGYNYYGTETFYSGITGEPLPCDIYYGVVYYQRLRHMVKDKAQVRSTGPINALTRQPVKGRKKGGGIRFGEMERDSLLAHGAAFLLHDRLHNSSDRHIALVCKGCGSLLAPHSVPATVTTESGPPGSWSGAPAKGGSQSTAAGAGMSTVHANLGAADTGAAGGAAAGGAAGAVQRKRRQPICRACGPGSEIVPVPMPYVFRYLVNELAGMNIKIQLELGDGPYGAATMGKAV